MEEVSLNQDVLSAVLKAIGQNARDGFLLFNVNTQEIVYTNRSLIRLFDISHSSFLNQYSFFINHIIKEDVDYLSAELKKLYTIGRIENIEFRTRSHQGEITVIEASAYMVENNFIVGIFRDISNRREHENYIINYGAKKNTLLDMVTHNLSGPLELSKNLIRSLELVTGNNQDNAIDEHIQMIRANVNHCIEIVHDFLEEEHLVSEHIFTKANRFELISKINTILERFRKAYPTYHFDLTKNSSPVYISNDDVKFLQALNNLLSNAVKWSVEGNSITINVEEHNHQVSISVIDQGIGIPEKIKPFIFQRNSEAGRVGLKGEKSNGLGLYIVKRLVELMRGTVSFKSKEGVGSEFTMVIPKELR